MQGIKKELLNEYLKEYKGDDKQTILRHALATSELSNVIYDADDIRDIGFNFDINIKTLPATNQKRSGRCWIFAATNVLREIVAKNCNMDNFELSQSYIAMYDRLEKVNATLEIIIELIDKDYDDRTLTFILMNGIGDGGQWDMFVNVVNKYGLMPKHAFPETTTSSNTHLTNSLINFNLRKFASEAKQLYQEKGIEAVRDLKEKLLKKVYVLLVSCYGVVPETFDFEYTDKEGKYHLDKGLTPYTFKEKYIGSRLEDFVSIINAPTKDKPFNKTYTVKYLANVIDGKKVTHLNVDMSRMKELIIKQLKDEQITWFGSDVSFCGDRSKGIWDDRLYDSKIAFDMEWFMDKGESLDYRASQMNHAMCLTGVALQNDKPTKWKVQNSWGDDVANKGYYIMSDSWFDKFVYQAVVDKKYLNEKELKALKEEPIVLKPWDPMGSLAD